MSPSAVRTLGRAAAGAFESMKVPTHSVEAEQAVLGGLMLDNSKWDDVSRRIGADDFYRADHRLIFTAMVESYRAGIPMDAVTLAETMQNQNTLPQAGGLAYLAVLSRDTPTAANAAAYADIVRQRSDRRRMVQIAEKLRSDANGADEHAADNAILALMELTKQATNHEYDSKQMMRIALDELDTIVHSKGQLVGVSSGLKALDECLGGFQKGDLIVVGARPAMGKTAFMLNISSACSEPCGIISSEQGVMQVGMRLISINGRVSVHKMRTGDLEERDWKSILVGSTASIQRTLLLNDKPSITLTDLHRQARKWKSQNGLGLLLVDYIQKIKSDNPKLDTRERVTETTQGLKEIARELDVPVVALAMVSRKVEERENKRPGMSDFKESGAIEEEADQVLTLYRDEVYNKGTQDKGIAEINVLKNRHGPLGLIEAVWREDCMRFENKADDYYGQNYRGEA
jgi:replicative DNA helicase